MCRATVPFRAKLGLFIAGAVSASAVQRAPGALRRQRQRALVTQNERMTDLLGRLQAALEDPYTIERELGCGGVAMPGRKVKSEG